MADGRIFQGRVTANSHFTVTETRTVTTSVKTMDGKTGSWKTFTAQETYTKDGGQREIEEKTKKGFFSSIFKSKKDEPVAIAPKPTSGTGSNFEKKCLDTHNSYRAKHCAPPLTLSKELCKYASEWATKLAKEEKFQHRPSNKHGENIYMKWSSDRDHEIDGNEPVDDWYDEIKHHVFGREPTTLKSGHFTQVVWEQSRELGVGKAKSKSGKIIVVANYNPPGNMMGDFAKCVRPPRK